MTRQDSSIQHRRYYWLHRLIILNYPNLNYGLRAGCSLLSLLFGGLLLGDTAAGITASLGMIAALICGADEPKPKFWRKGAASCLSFFIAPLLLLSGLHWQIPPIVLFFVLTFGCAMFSVQGPMAARLGIANLLLIILSFPAPGNQPLWFAPSLYVLGAVNYLVISRVWQLLWPFKQLRENIADYYLTLAQYTELKCELILKKPFDNSELLPCSKSSPSLPLMASNYCATCRVNPIGSSRNSGSCFFSQKSSTSY
ncbi:FUSC family membrane protein [Dongshaea marina]|uniref:FUSC family membrane protein n=1 Tax=Dongshaea marina TaxID=2047966 RepID=UPI00131F2FC0|nr:FUSC family membrane protein [Dongshaea marina]